MSARLALLTLVLVGVLASGTASADHNVEHRIALFWQRIDALQPTDHVSSRDLGQWAQNVIERDPLARLTVADFRAATAGMQTAIDRAGKAPATAPPPPTPTPTPAALILRVNEFVRYTDGWRVQLLRTEPQAPGRFSTPRPGLEFRAIVVRYENGTSAEANYGSYDWEMQDSAGVRRGPSFYLGDRTDMLNSGKLAPGGFVQGAVVFEVPVGDTRLSAIYETYGYMLATWRLY